MNLILIIIDSLRKDHVGAYGNEWIKTPNLDAFFRESVRFTRAYPESLPTLPMRRSTHTGKRIFPFRGWVGQPTSYPIKDIFKSNTWIPGWNPIPWEDRTMAEYLNDYNYVSGYFTDCFHQVYPGMNFQRGFHAWEWIRGQEWDCFKTNNELSREDMAAGHFTEGMLWEERKPWELKRYMVNVSERHQEEDYFPAQVFRKATKWLEHNYREENLFLCVDCFDPHEPWDPPQYYRDLYNPGYRGTEVLIPIYYNQADKYLSPSELEHMRALYAGEVTLVDRWFGHLMDSIRLMGLDKNSVIAVISDHGHQLGENNMTGKLPWGLYPCLVDLALGIRHPDGIGAGTTCDAFTMNHDLMPTLFHIMGRDIPDQCEGVNMWPVAINKEPALRDHASTVFKDYLWVANDHWALIGKNDKTELELYNLETDPEYKLNVAEANPKIVEEMWNLLLEDAGGDIPVPGKGNEPFLDKNYMQ